MQKFSKFAPDYATNRKLLLVRSISSHLHGYMLVFFGNKMVSYMSDTERTPELYMARQKATVHYIPPCNSSVALHNQSHQ